MPHLIMEYSNSVEERLNVTGLLEDLHQVALKSGLFEAQDVKSRSQRYQHWLIGDNADSVDFIHVRFELLAGRGLEQKQQLSEAFMAILTDSAGQIESLTVDIRDMDKAAFLKVTSG